MSNQGRRSRGAVPVPGEVIDRNLGDERMAKAALAKLAELSNTSDDKLIDAAHHGAAGAVLFSRHDYKGAILHLAEDANNPLSLRLLAMAYRDAGYTSEAKSANDTQANLNDPTLEQALIVPPIRKCIQNPSCVSSIQKVSYKH